MSDEDTTTEVQPEQQPESVSDHTPPEDNSLFRALYDAAGDEEEAPDVNPTPAIGSVSSLTESLDSIERGDEPEAPAAEADSPAAPEVVKEGKPKKKKAKQVVDPDVAPEDTYQEPYYAPPEDPDAEFMDGLLPEERDLYEVARYADARIPEHKGVAGKFKKYFGQTKDYVEQRLKQDPHTNLSEDQEYREFIQKNRPEFSSTDAKKAERAMITEVAEQRAMQRMQPEIARMEQDQKRSQMQPRVNQAKMAFRQLGQEIMPDELIQTIKDNPKMTLEDIKAQDPLKFHVMDQVSSNMLHFADTFIEITSGLVDYDASNQVHQELMAWVEKEQEGYVQSGNTKRDGKTFMRRERFYQLPEGKRSEYYTWSDQDLLTIMAMRAKQQMGAMLDYQAQQLKAAGYAKNGASVPQQPAQQQQRQQQAPVVNPSPRPGNVPDSSAQQPQDNAILKTLGL